MATYSYTFLTLRDEQVIEEIPLSGVFAQRLLGTAGQFNGTMILDQTGKNNIDLIGAATAGKTWLVMERIDSSGVATPVWWGLVWAPTYQSQAKTIELFGWGFEAYPTKQFILDDIDLTGMGYMQAFAYLWSNMQASRPGRNINVNVPTVIPPESTVSLLSALATDWKVYHDLMAQLADGTNGFDWTITLTKQANNVYRKDLIMGTPTLGVTGNATLSFEYPGNILNYYRTSSMADAGTHIFGFGAGEGSSQLISRSFWTDLIDTGFPRWDVGVPMKDVDNQPLLDQLTAQEALKRKPPMLSYVVTVKGDRDPVIGSYNIGDSCQLLIKDAMHPDGMQVDTRIIGYELHPQGADGVEEVKIILPV